MADYISRDEALKALLGEATKYGQQLQAQGKHMTRNEGNTFRRDYEAIKTIPAADVVPVVRCKDCRYFGKTQSFLCSMHNRSANGDDYCSYAVRKEFDNAE